MRTRPAPKAFTLIELLIVVAIIAILAAIAVPNFLEAQTRSKVARTQADMRAIATAVEAYIIDYNTRPIPELPQNKTPDGFRTFSDPVCGANSWAPWWGFINASITTPVAYMSSVPSMPFFDDTVFGFWRALGGSKDNQPYTMIRATSGAAWPVGAVVSGGIPAPGMPTPIPQLWRDNVDRSSYVIYNGGPDGIDSTVWGGPMFYDPTNGTISYGDVYRFGSGSATDQQQDRCN